MVTKIKIEQEDSELVERLFIEFNGYCNILGYLSKYGSFDESFYDRKWEEAVQLNHQLEEAKAAMDRKYHPNDGYQYSSYSFNFADFEMEYTDER